MFLIVANFIFTGMRMLYVNALSAIRMNVILSQHFNERRIVIVYARQHQQQLARELEDERNKLFGQLHRLHKFLLAWAEPA